ncbi:DUF6248 family natural product biosynthesis protein [Streptomyces echinatus]|uniref:DUF6248 family natural product biosynthesis protein n=1 Tax=Streptomyces echinatus TaxID=67293 RepID=UPI00378E2AB9
MSKLIVRPDDAPCVWWCRCPCPKDDSTTAEPAAPVKAEAGPAEPSPVRRPEEGAARGGRRRARGGEVPDEAQYTLF